jgi:hypothetical protein
MIMQGLVEEIKRAALNLIACGQKETAMYRVWFVLGQNCYENRGLGGHDWPQFEAAPHDYNPETMKGYKTLKEWSTRP